MDEINTMDIITGRPIGRNPSPWEVVLNQWDDILDEVLITLGHPCVYGGNVGHDTTISHFCVFYY